MVRAVFALLLVVAIAHVATAQLEDSECPENMHYNSCGTACPNTCATPVGTPQRCTHQCVPGCECNDGYVLSKLGAGGKCVKPKQC